MDIFKIVLIAFISTTFCIVLKQTRKEIALVIGIVTVLIILAFAFSYIGQVIELIKELSNKAGLPSNFLQIILKIIGISYIVEFGSDICKDAGEGAIASKIQFAGKCVILTLGMTIIGNFVDVVSGLV